MSLFNVWHPQQHSKTTIIARTAELAVDTFCIRWGYADIAHYCRCNELGTSDLYVESVAN